MRDQITTRDRVIRSHPRGRHAQSLFHTFEELDNEQLALLPQTTFLPEENLGCLHDPHKETRLPSSLCGNTDMGYDTLDRIDRDAGQRDQN